MIFKNERRLCMVYFLFTEDKFKEIIYFIYIFYFIFKILAVRVSVYIYIYIDGKKR